MKKGLKIFLWIAGIIIVLSLLLSYIYISENNSAKKSYLNSYNNCLKIQEELFNKIEINSKFKTSKRPSNHI